MVVFSFIDISKELESVRNSKEFLLNDPEKGKQIASIIETIDKYIYDFIKSIKELIKSMLPQVQDNNLDFLNVILPVVGWIMFAISVILLLFVLFKLLEHYRKIEKKESIELMNITKGVIDSSSWFDRAKNYAQDKQYREACRAIYMSLILYLDEKNIIKYDEAKTNLEYLQTVRSEKDLYSSLKQIINKFEYLWYGKHQGSSEDYTLCMNLYQKVLNE